MQSPYPIGWVIIARASTIEELISPLFQKKKTDIRYKKYKL